MDLTRNRGGPLRRNHHGLGANRGYDMASGRLLARRDKIAPRTGEFRTGEQVSK